MSFFIFDIETIPLSDAQLSLVEPEFTAPGNYKDPDKIASAIAEKRAEWKEKAALSPITGRVAMVGIRTTDTKCLTMEPKSWDDEAEMDALETGLLAEFWRTLEIAKHDGRLLIGFNSHRFDLPFLMRRSWKLGVSIPIAEQVTRGFNAPFIDLMQRWQAGNREDTISLDRLSRFLGVGQKNGEGKEVANLLRTNPAAAIEYLQNDLLLTQRCAEKMLTLF